jgi:hypothetical protein
VQHNGGIFIHEGRTMQGKTIQLTAELTDSQAWNLAQFLKRIGFSDFRNNARDDDEAYAMRDAAELVCRALAESGVAPR